MSGDKDFSDVISALAIKRGFFWGPSPEIYGGSSGFYDLGPLGKLLKNRLERVIRKEFVTADFWEIESPTVSPREVWEASGHLEGFIDPIVTCEKCGQTYRADDLIKEEAAGVKVEAMDLEEMSDTIRDLGIECPSCSGSFGEVESYNLMLETRLGLDQQAYLRPETATTTYLLFKRLMTFFRDKLPASVFQIGKAYRNEISPRQGLLRLREFTQVEGQIFITDEDEENWADYDEVTDVKLPLLPAKAQLDEDDANIEMVEIAEAKANGYFETEAYAWCVYLAYEIFSGMGFTDSNMRLRQHLPDERAHYAKDAWDVEIHTDSFGWIECCGVHDRGDYDLKRHQEYSGESMAVNVGDEKIIPNVLEIAFGVERPLYCLIDNAYRKDGKRVWLKLEPEVAPVQVAVFPLMSKDKLMEPAREIYEDISDSGLISQFDYSGSIGRRYRRQDEIGTPFCVTIDYDTLEDGTVTIREIETMKQIRRHKDELVSVLMDLVRGKKDFKALLEEEK